MLTLKQMEADTRASKMLYRTWPRDQNFPEVHEFLIARRILQYKPILSNFVC